ncbi:MAG: Zn-ribbon domain-containing OB-fold protein [Dehalococcoidia bacterium]
MTSEEKISKPIPEPDEASRPFFEGGMQGKLMLTRCSDCGAHRMPGRMHCDVCLSTDSAWVQASGRGTVRQFGVMHQKYHPGFFGEMPYNLALIELEEGPRLVSNLVGVANEQIRVDMPVRVDFEVHEDSAIPKFRPI